MATPRGPYDPIIVGADIGNATTTVVAHGQQPRVAFFPSFIATLGVGAYEGLSKIETTRHHISAGGANAVIGSDALDHMGADTLLMEADQDDAWRRYTNDRSLFCFLAGISAAFVQADAVGVTLATGAPLSIYQAHGEAIRRRYIGTHEYSYNGHARKVIVKDVKVYGEGREVLRLLPPEERRGRVAVHDLGGRTWNVLFFKDGALVGARTFDLGIERLLSACRSVSSDPGARWLLQQELRRGGKAHGAARAELEGLIADALHTIEQKVRIDKAERHALVGGGAVYLPPVLMRRYRVPATIVNGDAPEAVNALAYALAASEVA
jgi:hypothetical protein